MRSSHDGKELHTGEEEKERVRGEKKRREGEKGIEEQRREQGSEERKIREGEREGERDFLSFFLYLRINVIKCS